MIPVFSRIENLEWLWLVAGVALVAILGERSRHRLRQAFEGSARVGMRSLRPGRKAGVVLCAELIALSLLVAALADPRWGRRLETVREPQVQLVVAIDVSRSMLAQDAAPSRFERARAVAAHLMSRLGGERVALVAFAGTARTVMPLTRNYAEAAGALDELSPALGLTGGSDLASAFEVGCNAFLKRAPGEKILLVLTDGEDLGHADVAPRCAAAVARSGCRAVLVGLGDPVQGSRIPIGAAASATEFLQYQGKTVWSRRNDELLGRLAALTHGVYRPFDGPDADLQSILTSVLPANSAELHERRMSVSIARFPWFLGAVLLVLLGKQWFEREAAPSSRRRSGARLVAALCLMAAALGATSDDRIRRANAHFRAGRFEEALAGYQDAALLAGDPQLFLYNQAVVYYRAGNRQAAREKLAELLSSPGQRFAGEAAFLMGNCDYADVVAGGLTKDVAIERLRRAIKHYRRALDFRSDWDDPRANIELADMFMRQIERGPESSSRKSSDGTPSAQDARTPPGGSNQPKDRGGESDRRPPGSGSQPPGGTPRTDGTKRGPSFDDGPLDGGDAQRQLNEILERSRQQHPTRRGGSAGAKNPVDKDW